MNPEARNRPYLALSIPQSPMGLISQENIVTDPDHPSGAGRD